jgi:hypothetical protein
LQQLSVDVAQVEQDQSARLLRTLLTWRARDRFSPKFIQRSGVVSQIYTGY